MDKPIRKAVRCYLIKDNKVVVTNIQIENLYLILLFQMNMMENPKKWMKKFIKQ